MDYEQTLIACRNYLIHKVLEIINSADYENYHNRQNKLIELYSDMADLNILFNINGRGENIFHSLHSVNHRVAQLITMQLLNQSET